MRTNHTWVNLFKRTQTLCAESPQIACARPFSGATMTYAIVVAMQPAQAVFSLSAPQTA